MYFLCFTAYFTTPFAKYPEHFNQPLTEMASGPQFTTVEFGSLLPSRRDRKNPKKAKLEKGTLSRIRRGHSFFGSSKNEKGSSKNEKKNVSKRF